MQYTIPQFIETEDKIIGPLTLKQFIYILSGGILLFIIWYFSDLSLFLFLAIPTGSFFLALAFYKVNDRPFIYFLAASLRYIIRPKVRIWQREETVLSEIKTDYTEKEKKEREKTIREKLKISRSSLEKLAYVLDTEGGIEEKLQITNSKSKNYIVGKQSNFESQ